MAYMIQIDTYIFKSSCYAVDSAKGGGGGEGELPKHLINKLVHITNIK